MGYITRDTISCDRLTLTWDDLRKQQKRADVRDEYETGKVTLPYMKRFAARLIPCPECGRTPIVLIVRDFTDERDVSIKLVCPRLHQSKIMIGCGDWHNGLAKAGRSWNARARGGTENIDGKLHGIGVKR